MNEVEVRVRLPDGDERVLVPGDLIGRTARAALRIEDPRISEAHAMVSLRGAELKLLALRGRISVDGRPVSSASLVPGARVVLAGYYALTVSDVTLPDEVLALALDPGQGGPLTLSGVMTLNVLTPPHLVPRFDPGAQVIVWADEAGVWFRIRDAADRHLTPGAHLLIDGVRVAVVNVPLGHSESGPTMEQGKNDIALKIALHYDTVHVRPATGVPVVFDGLPARLLTEVAQLETPVSWLSLAQLLWDDEDDEHVLRHRWDQATSRIRKKLRVGRVRADLLRSSGGGLIELYLGPDDVVEDLT